VAISSDSITSNLIRGTFFAPISDASATETSLTFATGSPLPIVISGGDSIDPYSAYLLAFFAHVNGGDSFFEYWLVKAGLQGLVEAQLTLGAFLMGSLRHEDAAFWFTLASQQGHEFGRLVVSQFLFEATDANADPALAENILVELAKGGYAESWYYLGFMHTALESKEFASDPALGIEYLEKSVEETNDAYAVGLLAQCRAKATGAGGKAERRKQDAQDGISVGAVGIAVAAGALIVCSGLILLRRLLRK
jgi:hypothetical protein